MTAAVDEKLDLALLRRLEPAAFAAFVQRYQSFVLGLAQSLGLSGADCDDTAAETFAIAYRALPAFRGDSELSTWLYRIGYRTALRVRRRYPAQPEFPTEVADQGSESPAVASQRQETEVAVWQAVARLDPEQALAVEMFYRRGMGVAEIASVMEKPDGTIKTLLFRGRERLRLLLKPLENER